jgi:hypothetical protein
MNKTMSASAKFHLALLGMKLWKWNRIIRYPYLLKHKYGYPYSNSNVVVKWIHPNSFLSIFSLSDSIRIRLYKTVSYVSN